MIRTSHPTSVMARSQLVHSKVGPSMVCFGGGHVVEVIEFHSVHRACSDSQDKRASHKETWSPNVDLRSQFLVLGDAESGRRKENWKS